MKIINCLGLSLTLLAGLSFGARADSFRTDINPALIYYQAFLLEPSLPQADRDYLFTNSWRIPLPDRAVTLISGYTKSNVRLWGRAAAQTPPCDWGIDFTPGPETWLPHLAYCKRVAQVSRLLAMRDLQDGDGAGARDLLLSALNAGRNASRDGTMIAMLVQIAIERIMVATVAENFQHFSPQTLQQLEDGFDAAPVRATVASTLTMERFSSGHWLNERIQEMQKAHPGDEAAVMNELQQVVQEVDYENETNYWQKLTNSAGGTVAGVIKMTDESVAFAQELAPILILPHGEFENRFDQFSQEVQKSGDYIMIDSLDAWSNSKRKEFTAQVELAMLRAGIEYKLHGEAGLKSVSDPCGNGPFSCERFIFQGTDRGFALKSTFVPSASPQNGHAAEYGFQINPAHVPVTMIFVEKDGPAFNVVGTHAGEPLTP